MLGNERAPHFASLAKYAAAFFRMSRSSVDPRQFSLELPDLLRLFIAPAGIRCVLLAPRVERVGAHPQTLRHLQNRISSLGDLTHRVTLELVAEIAFAHVGLLASKLGKKASTNLRAIQNAVWEGSSLARGKVKILQDGIRAHEILGAIDNVKARLKFLAITVRIGAWWDCVASNEHCDNAKGQNHYPKFRCCN